MTVSFHKYGEYFSGTREVFAVFVEADGHNPVCCVEGLLNPITMMDVDIYVENSLVIFQQLQNGQHYVIHVAETTCLTLLGVMKASSPIDSYVCCLLVQFNCASH